MVSEEKGMTPTPQIHVHFHANSAYINAFHYNLELPVSSPLLPVQLHHLILEELLWTEYRTCTFYQIFEKIRVCKLLDSVHSLTPQSIVSKQERQCSVTWNKQGKIRNNLWRMTKKCAISCREKKSEWKYYIPSNTENQKGLMLVPLLNLEIHLTLSAK